MFKLPPEQRKNNKIYSYYNLIKKQHYEVKNRKKINKRGYK